MLEQLSTLATVGDPTTAYSLLLSGGVLVIVECLRPGIVWAGIGGAVLMTISVHALSSGPWTWYGSALLVLAGILAIFGLRTRNPWPRILSALVFGAGSMWLMESPGQVHPAVAGAGAVFALVCNWLLWLAGRARMAKRMT